MPKHRPFIAVDWGTSNRRAYAIATDGTIMDRLADDHGVLSIDPKGFEGEVSELRARMGDLPMLLAGMVGSNLGWVDVAYAGCPADFDAVAAGVKRLPGFEAAIVPGLKSLKDGRADVMRGEEVQLLGAMAAGLLPSEAGACHPGTHAKWVNISQGAVIDFRTVMTGELFALLRKHSSLSGQLRSEANIGPAFTAGVLRAYETPQLSADLFNVRASCLLGALAEDDAASYASGLLIGADLAIGLGFIGRSNVIPLIGDPHLTKLYADALRQIGRDALAIDGEIAFLEGIRTLAEKLW